MRNGTALVFEFDLSCNGLRSRLLETMSRAVYIQCVCCRVEDAKDKGAMHAPIGLP